MVTKRHTSVGAYVNVGAPVLTLLDDQTMEIAKHSLIEVLDKEFYIKISLTSEENQP